MRSYTGAVSTNRPSPAAAVIAAIATLCIAACAIVGALTLRGEGGDRPSHHIDLVDATLLHPSVGRGAESQVCKNSPKSPRCLSEGGNGLYVTPGGHALRPAGDSPAEAMLDSGEGDEAGPADMPGRVPGRGGWVSEEGTDWA